MDSAEILAKLLLLKPKLQVNSRVESLAVFGSVVRGDVRPDSDIDILVEFRKSPGYFGFVELKDELSKSLGGQVDLFTPAGLHPALRDKILAEEIDV